MDTLQIAQIVLQCLIVPVGAGIAQVAHRIGKIENELNSRIVRLETLVEIALKMYKGNNDHADK